MTYGNDVVLKACLSSSPSPSSPSSAMARHKHSMSNTGAAEQPENRRRINAERSAYFARREAAKVLRLVLQGDARRRAVGTIKSLVYSPSVRNKRGTFALVCQTLKRKLAPTPYSLEAFSISILLKKTKNKKVRIFF